MKPLSLYWHMFRTKHHPVARRVSVPMFDMSAKGILWRCTGCERTWAQ